jgi:aminoglycoside phosphotransferase
MLPNQLLPDLIAERVGGYERREYVRRSAPSRIELFDRQGRVPLILKIAPDLDAERRRLEWLKDYLPVPEVVAFASDGDADYLLMTRFGGEDGTSEILRRQPGRLVDLMAEALRMVHAVPVDDCPFSYDIDTLIDIAEQRVRNGLLKAGTFAPRYLNASPNQLLEALHRLRPTETNTAFTHGDPSLPNFMFDNDQVNGIIDVGLAGISDPYWDLAVASRTIAWNIGGYWIRPFFEAYGANLDTSKVEFFTLLDELVMTREFRRG